MENLDNAPLFYMYGRSKSCFDYLGWSSRSEGFDLMGDLSDAPNSSLLKGE